MTKEKTVQKQLLIPFLSPHQDMNSPLKTMDQDVLNFMCSFQNILQNHMQCHLVAWYSLHRESWIYPLSLPVTKDDSQTGITEW